MLSRPDAWPFFDPKSFNERPGPSAVDLEKKNFPCPLCFPVADLGEQRERSVLHRLFVSQAVRLPSLDKRHSGTDQLDH